MPITPTRITKEDQIYLVGSPVYINVPLQDADPQAKIEARLSLYIWSGNLNEPPTLPTYTLREEKISASDNYISFQISELISSHINNTRFIYVAGDNDPTIAGEGVFFQAQYEIITNETLIQAPVTLESGFATNGYRYDYEQVGESLGGGFNQPYRSLKPINYNRNYSHNIKYFKRSFDLTKTLSQCTSENIIKSEINTPNEIKCQLGDKVAIYYINRLGLWDCFTPFGKFTKTNKIDSETTPRLFRNPRNLNNSIVHSSERAINKVEQSYTVNTGALTELMNEQVEELIYSPLVYIVEFSGGVFEIENIGLTVDTTLISADTTLISADNQAIKSTDLGFYSEFKQIPVTSETSTFVLKTRLNDKEKINYDLQFDSTTDKRNNVR